MSKRKLFEGLNSVVLWHLAEERQEEEKGKSTIAFGRFYDEATKDSNSDMLFDGVKEFNELYSDRYHAILVYGYKYNYAQVITLEYLVKNYEELSREFNGLPDLEKTKKIINIL